MTYTMITFRCKECGTFIRVLIRNEFKLIFSFEGKLISTEFCLTEHGYFKCVDCNTVDKYMKFNPVFN